jgi:hypothetical protein
VEGETHGEEPRLYGPGQADELVSVSVAFVFFFLKITLLFK